MSDKDLAEAGPEGLPGEVTLVTFSPHQTLLVPVTMTVRRQVFLRAWMTGAVCGFSTFRMTSSPRRLSSRSTASLRGASQVMQQPRPLP